MLYQSCLIDTFALILFKYFFLERVTLMLVLYQSGLIDTSAAAAVASALHPPPNSINCQLIVKWRVRILKVDGLELPE